jgi:uncharacterized Zn finger protein
MGGPMRENAASKARRYLTEGRLTITRVDGREVRARVRGDGAIYRTEHDTTWGWSCTCPARGRCCHLLALGLVVSIPEGGTREHTRQRPRALAAV